MFRLKVWLDGSDDGEVESNKNQQDYSSLHAMAASASHKSTLLPLDQQEETKTLIVGLDCYM